MEPVTVEVRVGAHVLRGREVERVEVTEQMGAHTVCRLVFDRDPSAPERAAAALRVSELADAAVTVSVVGGAPPAPADSAGADAAADPAPLFSGEVRWAQETHLPGGASRLVVVAASRSWHWDAYAQYRTYPKHDLAALAGAMDVTVEQPPPRPAAGDPLTLVQWGESDWAFLARYAAEQGAYLAPTEDGVALRAGFAGGAHELVWGQNLVRLASMVTPTNHGVKGAAFQADAGSPMHDHRYHAIRQDPAWSGGAGALVDAAAKAAPDAEGGGDPTTVTLPRRAPTLAAARDALARESTRRLGESVWVTGQSTDPAVRAGGKVDVRAATGAAGAIGAATDWTLDVEGVLGVVRVAHAWADGLYRNEFAATPWSGYVPPARGSKLGAAARGTVSGGRASAPGLAPGLVPAVVVANADASGQGRVRVRYAWMAPGEPGVWARVALPYAGHERGTGWVPEAGDEVVVAHVAGDPERPVVVGAVHNGRARAGHGPGLKQLVTLAGHTLSFAEGRAAGADGAGGPAAPAVLELHTPGGRALLRMENAVGGPPRVTLHSDGDLELHAPHGQVRVTARDVVTHASGAHATGVGGAYTVQAQGGATVASGGAVHVEAAGAAALVAGGVLQTHAGAAHHHTGAPMELAPAGGRAPVSRAQVPQPVAAPPNARPVPAPAPGRSTQQAPTPKKRAAQKTAAAAPAARTPATGGCKDSRGRSVACPDKAKVTAWMRSHAEKSSTGKCAKYVRQGLEGGGFNTAGRPVAAGDYGPFLERRGASAVSSAKYSPLEGDIVVYAKTAKHEYGHIAIYDGKQWISDWKQRNMNPYKAAKTAGSHTIYRFPN